jgi:glycosyltransferase involved in cell wall biosynthesis
MKIAVLAHVRHPVAAPFMGGMEAHAHALVTELARRGHAVTLFASGDSAPPRGVTLAPILPEHYDRAFPWHRFHGTEALNRHLDTAFAAVLPQLAYGGFDVVHNNSLHRYPPRLARRIRLPMLTSLHVPPFDALRRAVHASGAPWSRFTICSEHQRGLWSDGEGDGEGGGFAHVVANGVDTARWAFCSEGDGSAVWFGRITPNKGTAEAVQAARLAGVPLRIYGPAEHADYFAEAVAPHLGHGVSYHGALPPAELAQAVGRASVALFTPRWDEPFGLAAVEAMACGVPVAAFGRGAVPEVLGAGGVIAAREDAQSLAEAMGRARRLSRRAVRAAVLARFTTAHMVAGYEALYARCIAGLSESRAPVDFAEIELPGQAVAESLKARTPAA